MAAVVTDLAVLVVEQAVHTGEVRQRQCRPHLLPVVPLVGGDVMIFIDCETLPSAKGPNPRATMPGRP